jgi:hypothetical protein
LLRDAVVIEHTDGNYFCRMRRDEGRVLAVNGRFRETRAREKFGINPSAKI